MQLNGVTAGVPWVAQPPAGGSRPDAPVVIGYHLLDAPRTEEAFAAAVPLTGLDAWKIYPGLPMSGSRLPAGGAEELWRLVLADAVRNVHGPILLGALAEFPALLTGIRGQLRLDPAAPVGVMGGSMGGAVAQLALAEGGIPVRAAVLINPVVRLRDTIDALSAFHGTHYTWAPQTAALAERIDFVRRAADLSGTAIRFVTGADDMVDAIIDPVAAAVPALRAAGGTVDWQVVPDMAHALADEPGVDAAPQTPHAAIVDGLATDWFRRSL